MGITYISIHFVKVTDPGYVVRRSIPILVVINGFFVISAQETPSGAEEAALLEA